MNACLAGPDPDRGRAEVEAMLASTRFVRS